MKRNITYIAILLFFAAAVIFIRHSKKEAANAPHDMDFAVKDIETVDRIVLSNRKDTADLRREAGHWKINGKYRVMQPKMKVLLETMQRLIIQGPVANNRRQAVLQDFDKGSTKVEVYRADDAKPFKTYYVDGNTEDSKGTYMLMELNGRKAERPFVMVVPGFTGILSVRYFTDETGWRDTKVFDYSPGDIKQITVSYPQLPGHSFYINVAGDDSFAVYPVQSDGSPQPAEKVYKEGVIRYLSLFRSLHAEGFDNNNSKKDSIISSTPYVSVAITDKNNNVNRLVVYYMSLNRRSKQQVDRQGIRLPYDLDRYYATINSGNDFVTIQDFVFGKIFRRYSDFVLKATPAS